MLAVITGDIVHSQSTDTAIWNNALVDILSTLGKRPRNWDIYRGDSFQTEVNKPADALTIAILIKASIKKIKGLDVRLAIGIGDKSFDSDNITQCNGPAFIHSGHILDDLNHSQQRLAIKSPWPEFDENINVHCLLASIAMDKWLVNAAEVMQYTLLHPDASQAQIGEALGIAQNTVSERLTRAHKDEIMIFIALFTRQINEKMAAYGITD